MILISCYTDDHFRSFDWNWLLCPNCVGKHAKGLLYNRLKSLKISVKQTIGNIFLEFFLGAAEKMEDFQNV